MRISVRTTPHYPIFVDQWNLRRSLSVVKKNLREDRLFIITNTTVAKLYKAKLDPIFRKKIKTAWIVIPDGERYKNLKTCEKIWLKLAKLGANRSSCLLALGGGVVGDITGFVASTYMRGIRYFQMPTTLLAQVDASIGGKTGIDLSVGKNLVGTFHQPKAAFIHTDFLKTLPFKEFRHGLAEIVKYALMADQGLWKILKTNTNKILQRNTGIIKKIIHSCAHIKADIVALDEKEKNLRRILNLGHTLGHAIEQLGKYKTWKHGEAVAMGLVFAAELSHRLGISKKHLTPEIVRLLKAFHLPTAWPKYSQKKYRQALKIDKKANSFVFLKEIGDVIVKSVTTASIWNFL
jgi:3-dehydroquinate synthase